VTGIYSIKILKDARMVMKFIVSLSMRMYCYGFCVTLCVIESIR